eukprot:495663_1
MLIYLILVLNVESTNYYCVNETDCNGLTFNSNDTVNAYGYKTLYAAPAQQSQTLSRYCDGAMSCAQTMSINTSNMYCFGYGSCSNIQSVEVHNIYVWGSNAMMHSNLTLLSSAMLQCYGYQSCAHSSINHNDLVSHSSVLGYAALSLYNSSINVLQGSITIELIGYYAGYNAFIHCRDGTTCNIYCNHNGCGGLELICDNSAICIISKSSNSALLPNTIISAQEILFLNSTTTEYNVQQCSTQTTNKTFDIFNAHYQGPDLIYSTDEGPICCRGMYSCRETVINYNDAITASVICSGHQSCYSTPIQSNSDIKIGCYGYYSCQSSTILGPVNNGGTLYCYGRLSCWDTIIIAISTIICNGISSCRSTNITSNSNMIIYLNGYLSGWNTSIECNAGDTCNILCNGFQSCLNTTLICNELAQCVVDCNENALCPIGYTYNPTTGPTFTPSSTPSYYPSINPTVMSVNPTQSVLDQNYELIGLNMSITAENDTNLLYELIEANTSRFGDIIKHNIFSNYNICSNIYEIFQFLYHNDNNSLYLSYDIKNYDQQIENLIEYLESISFKQTISNGVSNSYNLQNVQIKNISTVQKHSFLPEPLNISDLLNMHNPVSIILFSMLIVLLLLMIIGYSHNVFSTVYDCFHPLRIIFYLFSVLTHFSTLNTTYSYIYGYTAYDDSIFLVIGIISLLLVILKIISHCFAVQHFEDRHDINHKNERVGIWLNQNRNKLILFIIVSASFPSSLSLINCNLFNFSLFSMKISVKQLQHFRIQNWKSIFLLFAQLLIHTFMVFYIFIKYDSQQTLKWFTIITVVLSLFNSIRYFLIKYLSPKTFPFEATNINIKIEIDDDQKMDRMKLQKQKNLTKQLRLLMAKMLEMNENNIEILYGTETLKGIIVSGIVYKRIQNAKYKTSGLELQQTLLSNKNDNVDEIQINNNQLEQIMVSQSFQQSIQQIYGLTKTPQNIDFIKRLNIHQRI